MSGRRCFNDCLSGENSKENIYISNYPTPREMFLRWRQVCGNSNLVPSGFSVNIFQDSSRSKETSGTLQINNGKIWVCKAEGEKIKRNKNTNEKSIQILAAGIVASYVALIVTADGSLNIS